MTYTSLEEKSLGKEKLNPNDYKRLTPSALTDFHPAGLVLSLSQQFSLSIHDGKRPHKM